MTAQTGWLGRVVPKVHAPPEWGIEPVPQAERKLGFVDFAVLWSDLGLGLLVLLAGSFLVPGLGLSQALTAIVIGSAIGCTLLAVAGVVGSAVGAPTMVLLRPALGIRGSYLPTALNILQLSGWTIFEIVIMAYAANAISQSLGFNNYALWAAFFIIIVILMGISGPMAVIRQWLSKVAVWVMIATTLWLTYHLLTTYAFAALWQKAGDGSLPFWVAVDIVISLPVSWMPLVADYNRFGRESRSAAWGTFVGYFITNVWFFALGAMILLAAQVTQEPKGFVTAIALTAGWLALVILLVDETDEAWADLYSAAVSLQNIFPHVRQRWFILGLGLLSFVIALLLDVTQYESFLLLIGSFFVPLFGVLIADYFVLRRSRYHAAELYRPTGEYWYQGGVHGRGVLAWLIGVLVFMMTNPSTLGAIVPDWPKLVPDVLTQWGGSIPSFIAAFVIYLLMASMGEKRS